MDSITLTATVSNMETIDDAKDTVDPEWEAPKRTPIPKDGWKRDDIGREVWIKLPHGTIVPDTIIVAHVGHDHNHIVIGPGHEVGGYLARIGHTQQVAAQAHAWQQQLRDAGFGVDFDDDEDGNGGIPI